MSVLDRLRKTESQTGESQSSLALADKPVIQRLKRVFSQLQEYSSQADGKVNDKLLRGSYILQMVMEEVCEELHDVDEIQLGIWFAQFGDIIRWVGTGNVEALPANLRQHLDEEAQAILQAEAVQAACEIVTEVESTEVVNAGVS